MTRNPIWNVVKMHMRSRWTWLYVPWIIVGASFVFNLILATLLREGESIYSGGLSSLFVYLFVTGIVIVPQTYHFMISMSGRRHDYFYGTVLAGAMSSLVSALALVLLSFLEHDVTNDWGVQLIFFHLPFISNVSYVAQLLVYFLTAVALFSIGLLIASVYRRFGGIGVILFLGLWVLIFTAIGYGFTYAEYWEPIGRWFATHTVFTLSLWWLPVILISWLASFLMLRRAAL